MATAVSQQTHERGGTALALPLAFDGRADWAASGPPGRDARAHELSLELNDDQLEIQRPVHRFAEDVMRPAAQEWDEREETSWPVIEDAAFAGERRQFGRSIVQNQAICHRDARIFTIFEGTSEIQRSTIARAISGVRAR